MSDPTYPDHILCNNCKHKKNMHGNASVHKCREKDCTCDKSGEDVILDHFIRMVAVEAAYIGMLRELERVRKEMEAHRLLYNSIAGGYNEQYFNGRRDEAGHFRDRIDNLLAKYK